MCDDWPGQSKVASKCVASHIIFGLVVFLISDVSGDFVTNSRDINNVSSSGRNIVFNTFRRIGSQRETLNANAAW